MQFYAAFKEFDITPLSIEQGNTVRLQGMAAKNYDGLPIYHETGKIGSRPKMQILLLEDSDGERALIIAADVFGFDSGIVEPVRVEAMRWGLSRDSVLINASHTHYNTGTVAEVAQVLGGRNSEYSGWLTRTICRSIPHLIKELEPCLIEYGEVEAAVGVSRRLPIDGHVHFGPNPAGKVDRSTPFLFLSWVNGGSVIVVAHGCHPTGLDQAVCLSADYPGFLRESLCESGYPRAMFLQAAGADVKPVWRNGNEIRFARNLVESDVIGRYLATAVLSGVLSQKKGIKPFIKSASHTLYLPLQQSDSDEKLKEMINGDDLLSREWADKILQAGSDRSRHLKITVSVLILGEVVLITLPAEPVAELAIELRSAVSEYFNAVIVLGYTNGLKGYLVTDQMLIEGGYESVRGPKCYLLPPFAYGVSNKIVKATLACLADAKQIFDENELKKSGHAFFVMSTGRCGTMTLSRVLNLANNARVWHHPQPDPIDAALNAFWGDEKRGENFWHCRKGVIKSAWRDGLVHGETNATLTPFCDAISTQLPMAKFLILIRHPKDFVCSGMRRSYYCTESRWDLGRLRPSSVDPGFEEWISLSEFEKVCHLWEMTYRHILKMVSIIGHDKVHYIRFEDLIKGGHAVCELYDFLGLTGLDEEKVSQVLAMPLNVQECGDFPSPDSWPLEMRQILWSICGDVGKMFGYELW